MSALDAFLNALNLMELGYNTTGTDTPTVTVAVHYMGQFMFDSQSGTLTEYEMYR